MRVSEEFTEYFPESVSSPAVPERSTMCSNGQSRCTRAPFSSLKFVLILNLFILLVCIWSIDGAPRRKSSIQIGNRKSTDQFPMPFQPTVSSFLDTDSKFRCNNSSFGLSELSIHLRQNLTFGLLFPFTHIEGLKRSFDNTVVNAIKHFRKHQCRIFDHFNLRPFRVDAFMRPNPSEIISQLCEILLPEHVVTLMFFTFAETESYTGNPVYQQYLLQLVSYLGIPVIAWNPDNMVLTKVRCFHVAFVFSVEHMRTRYIFS